MVASSHKTTPKDHLQQKASASQENSLKLLQKKMDQSFSEKECHEHLGWMFERLF